MAIEAGVWVALSLFAPAAAALVWPRLARRLGGAAPLTAEAARWLYSLGPGYLALLRGAVLGRDYGLYGQGWDGWLAGAAVCAAALIGGGWLLRRVRLPESIALPAPSEGLRQEVRWGFYRAAGALWSGAALGGVAIGLGLSTLEWGLSIRLWKSHAWRDPRTWVAVIRMALSSGFFLATRNLWLTIGAQIGLLILAQAARNRGPRPRQAGESGARAEGG